MDDDAKKLIEDLKKRIEALEQRPFVPQFQPVYVYPQYQPCQHYYQSPYWQVPTFPLTTTASGGIGNQI